MTRQSLCSAKFNQMFRLLFDNMDDPRDSRKRLQWQWRLSRVVPNVWQDCHTRGITHTPLMCNPRHSTYPNVTYSSNAKMSMWVLLTMREGDADGNGGSPELCRTCGKAVMPTASRMRTVMSVSEPIGQPLSLEYSWIRFSLNPSNIDIT